MRESFSFNLWYGWIAAAMILAGLFLMSECQPREAHAGEWSLDLKGGLAAPIITTADGTFVQTAFDHKTRHVTPTWAVGLSYQATPAWSLQAHWLDLGQSQIKGLAVADADYDHKHGRCTANCDKPYHFKATDTLRGVDLTATYTWIREGVRPFVKAGVAVLQHHAIFNSNNGYPDHFKGIVPELELGAGLAYQAVYVELDYFQGMNFGGQNLPISTQQVVGFVGVKIPLS